MSRSLRPGTWFLLAPAMTALTLTGLAQERPRSEIPDRYTWDLSEIYPSVTAWRAAKDTVSADAARLRAFQGKLGASAATLADALETFSALDKELSRAYVYASMLADLDTRDATHEGMRQQMAQVASTLAAEASFIEPEILRFPPGTVETFLAVEPRLKVYRFYIQDIARRARHTLSPAEEKILAAAGPMAGTPSGVFNILSNADFPYPRVRLSDGKDVVINPANYSAFRASKSREDRQAVMSAYFGSLGQFSGTFGRTMSGSVQKALFFARTRNYASSVEAALDGSNIPLSVYTRLVDGVGRNLPSFHRYLTLRKRVMGVSELHYYDLYAPLVGSVDLRYTPDEAERHVLAAMAPLGQDYQAVLKRAFSERWIDLFPSPGKRSGAYSQGSVYDVHPYMLLNYNGKYDDMSTLAHELGHTMQSYYSNKTQPYPTAGYPIFVAEVASTFNESLLIDYMLRTIEDDTVRLALLGNYLEGIKGTVFRQTQFAEFELRMHELGQKGEPITGEGLAKLYLDITKRYYGHDKGITVVDDYVAHEWSFVPHFYREFYVFQYATSFTASEALAQKVKSGDADATRRYLAFLAAGGSKYPIDLLKDAGVDMTTDEPLDLTMKEMNRVMDEMEAILARQPAR
jgi:oligoendopeptidase F